MEGAAPGEVNQAVTFFFFFRKEVLARCNVWLARFGSEFQLDGSHASLLRVLSTTFVRTVCRPRVSARPATCSFWPFVGRASLLSVRFPSSQASRTSTCAPGRFSFAKHGFRTARQPVRRRCTCVCGLEMASSARALVCFAPRRPWKGPRRTLSSSAHVRWRTSNGGKGGTKAAEGGVDRGGGNLVARPRWEGRREERWLVVETQGKNGRIGGKRNRWCRGWWEKKSRDIRSIARRGSLLLFPPKNRGSESFHRSFLGSGSIPFHRPNRSPMNRKERLGVGFPPVRLSGAWPDPRRHTVPPPTVHGWTRQPQRQVVAPGRT